MIKGEIILIKLTVGFIFLLILGIVGFVVWYFYMKVRFKTVSSNEALIITGTNLGNPDKEPNVIKDDSGRYMKVVRGGGHRLRMFQSSDKISLKSFQLKLDTPKVYTKDGVGLYGQAVATIKVSDSINGIVQYAEQFLGKKQKEIEAEIEEVLGSNLRAILSKMTVEEINGDRERFNEEVREIAQEQLDRMGFQITSLGLTDLKDDDGYLENLGKPQVARVKKTADIAEATNARETDVHVAKMKQEVAEEQYKREMQIAETRKEKDLKDSQIEAETSREKARSEAAYSLEIEERNLEIERKRLEIREQEKERELHLLRMERENAIALERDQVEVEKQKIEAEYLKKVRDAEAAAETKKLHAKSEAEAKKLAGDAEAEVIRKRTAAEVEALEKRAKAMNDHKEVLITEKVIEMLPEYAKAISSSLSNVESIRILDGGNGDQVRSLPNTVTSMMANMNEGLGQMTGIDLNEIIHNFTGGNKDIDVNELVNQLQNVTDEGALEIDSDGEVSNEGEK